MEVTRVVVSYTTASGALILAAIVASNPIAGDEVHVRDIESLQLTLVQRSHIERRQLGSKKYMLVAYVIFWILAIGD